MNHPTTFDSAAAAAPQLQREPGFVLLLGSLFTVRLRGGATGAIAVRPLISADRATPLRLLTPPLKSLARAIAPDQVLIECGGDGQCGPNVLSFLLGLLQLYDGDGRQLRSDIVNYVRAGRILDEPTQFQWCAAPHDVLTVRDLLMENMRTWPESVLQGRTINIQTWCDITDDAHAWTDLTFIQLCAARFGVEVQLIGVNDVGVVEPIMRIRPTGNRHAQGLIHMGCWLGQHFVALVDAARDPTPNTPTHEAAQPSGKSHSSERNSPTQPAKNTATATNNADVAREAAASFTQNTVEATLQRRGYSTIDLRAVAANCVAFIHISVLLQPLIFAHLDGYTVLGATLPEHRPKHQATEWVKRLCSELWSTKVLSFLVGVSTSGLRLFTAPVDYAPPPSQICRTSKERAELRNRGVTWAWCALAALRGASVAMLAAQAFLAATVFVRPPEALRQAAELGLTTEPLEFKLGELSARSVIRRPLVDTHNGPTKERALAKLLQQDDLLRSLLDRGAQVDARLEGWEERIAPAPIEEIPSQLLDDLPAFSDAVLHQIELPTANVPYQLPWVPLQPPQPSPSALPVNCPRPRNMLLPAAQSKADAWLAAQLRDLVHINTSLAQGVAPTQVDRRHRPKALAIGQTEVHQWARGIVWDCRETCCRPLRHDEPFSSDLNLGLVRDSLGCYPDQQMLSFVLEGVRLQADVELQMVMVPHLVSLPLGFRSVDKEIRRLQKLAWYDFFDDLPFFPIYLNGQGSVARKLEPDRFRRSTEGGGPRKATFDGGGVMALSLNEASRVHHTPAHWNSDSRPEFQAWVSIKTIQEGQQRHKAPWVAPNCDVGQPPAHAANPIWQMHTKWPKERKPTLQTVMIALAALCAAADFLDLPVYVFSDDAKDYFNQLGMATPEIWKMGIVFLEDLDKVPEQARLIFISEKRLGFGTHGASNTAQRFSDALLHMFADRMDESDAQAASEEANPQKYQTWQSIRANLNNGDSPTCHRTRQYARTQAQRKAGVQVCPQQRLWFAAMYTDDPIFIVVGASRAVRALQVWRQLTNELQLIMAIPEKRVLGSWALWIGALIIAPLGLVAIPRHKLMRAASVIQHLLDHGCPFHVYRSLCGLLEHFRAVNLQRKNVMHGLYEPHQRDGVSRAGPEASVKCSPLMRKQLQRWLRLIFHSGGVDVLAAVDAESYRSPASIQVVMDSDACHGDVDPSGIGGFMHGQYWYFPVPHEHLHEVDTPMLEFLGVCFNILIFGAQLTHHEGEVLLRTDALTAALTLPMESMRSAALVAAFQYITNTQQWQSLAHRLRIQHIFGDANALADPISRAKWEEFHTLCAQLGIYPRRVEIHGREDIQQLFLAVCREGVRAKRSRVGAEAPTSPALTASQAGGMALSAFRAGGLPSERSITKPSPRLLEKLAVRAETPGACLPSDPSHAHAAHALRKLVRSPRTPSAAPADTSQETAALPMPVARPYAGLLLPPQLPKTKTNPVLARISQHMATQQANSFAQGEHGMRFDMPSAQLHALSAAIHEGVDYGINANTALKDSRAWVMWEHVCSQHGTNPFRTEEEVRLNPQRNAHLLAALLLHAFAIGVPRNPQRQFIKPRSALAYPLAIIRIFGRWGVSMPSYKQIKASLAHLSRQYIAYHGPYSLAPQRAEPMKYTMVLRMNSISDTTVGRFPWHDDCQSVFMFKRLNLVLWPTGFRLGEVVHHSSGEVMYLTFESLTWCINGAHLSSPTAAQLRGLLANRDYALLAPPRSKPDQWGEIHCPYPVILTFFVEPGNAAAALRDLELHKLAHRPDVQRSTLALFHDDQGRPFTHAFLAGMLKDVLTHCFGANVATLYTWHSYRSGLATALHAAGVDDGMIMLICRWMSPESLHVYRRMGTAENERHTRRAMAANVDLIQTPNIPKVMGDQGYAELFNAYRTLAPPAEWASPNPPAAPACFEAGPAARQAAVPPPVADASPARTQSPPRPSPPTRTPRPRPAEPTNDAGSTTGVGRLHYPFPNTLQHYTVYNDRPSSRRAPTVRSRAQWESRGRRCQQG